MARKPRIPSTPALRLLKAQRVDHEVCPYDYVPRGGTAASSAALGVDEHAVIKTMVFEDERRQPFVILMHGDHEVSAKALARAKGAKSVSPCAPAVAERHTGYKVGGTSPFATRKAMPICVEASILDLPRIWINGGARGLLVALDPAVLTTLLAAERVTVAR